MTKTTIVDLVNRAKASLEYYDIPVSFAVDFVYNSLLFENNNLTSGQVEAVIANQENTDTKKDVVIRNHYAAFLFTIELVKRNLELEENDIKDIHEILMQDIGIGGLYRNVDISVKGSSHIPPHYMKVYDRMKKYVNTVVTLKSDPYQLFAYSLLQFTKIHPFLDGNGRCARLIMLFYILKQGYRPFYIPYNRKNDYFNGMEEFKVNKNINPFIDLLKECTTLK